MRKNKMNKHAALPLGLFFCLILLFCETAKAISIPSHRYVVTVYSQNKNYRATTLPYSRIEESCWGRTNVYDEKNSTFLYTIPECLTEGYLFISNDGTTVAHVLDWEYGSDTSQYITHVVSLYRNGKVLRRISLNELIHCDTCEQRLFFFDFILEKEDGRIQYIHSHQSSQREKVLADKPVFLYNDTVFIHTSTRHLIKLYLPTGQFVETDFDTFTLEQLSEMPDTERELAEFKNPIAHAFLKYDDSLHGVENALARVLNMKNDEEEGNNRDKYKYYRIYALLRIDREGVATIIEMENKDSLPDAALREAILGLEYAFPAQLPDDIDLWCQEIYAFLRKSDNRIAAKERKIQRKQEYEAYLQRLTADSINGIYIPRNIEECFLQLDTLLSAHLRNLILNTKSIKEIDGLHFGPGMWIRNNWGLWCGSRLQTYLLKRGLNHPDEMSGVIFDYYWDYLHGINERWRAFDAMRTKP